MKTVDSSLRAHLDNEVTFLSTCWIITRTDGQVLRFTDSDEDLVDDGETYQSIGSYKRTAIESTSTLSVDNLDVIGMANDLTLPVTELRAGLFDNAQVRVFLRSWLPNVEGKIKLRRGFFGQVQIMPNGTFQVELRGLLQRIAHTYTDIYSATCISDLGDSRCKVPIKPNPAYRGTTYALGSNVRMPQGTEVTGDATKIDFGDAIFATAGVSGIPNSLYWYNDGAVDLTVDNASAKSGTFSAVGGAGVGKLVQDIDIVANTGVSVAKIDASQIYLSLYAWRKDAGNAGSIAALFHSSARNVLGYGKELEINGAAISTSTGALAGDFTIETWVFMDHIGLGTDILFGSGVATEAGSGFEVSLSGNIPKVYANEAGDDGAVIITSPRTLTTGNWTHIALTRAGTTLTLYINGIASGSAEYTTSVNITKIGGGATSTGFSGRIDEFRVWDDVRTSVEMGIYRYESLGGAEANLVRYYNFNDGTADELTGNGSAWTLGTATIEDQTSPVAARVAHGAAAASYNSGTSDVGTDWVLQGVSNRQVPIGTRYITFNFNSLEGCRLDSVYGWLTDSTTNDIIPSVYNNVYWECTTAGTTAVTAPEFTGNVGATVTDGTVTWTARKAWTRHATVIDATDRRRFSISVNESRADSGWFNGGLVTFFSGNNRGASMECKTWDGDTGEVELFLSLPYEIEPGDLLEIYPGCDKSRIGCSIIFDNIANFFGTPDIPGEDTLFIYPEGRTD